MITSVFESLSNLLNNYIELVKLYPFKTEIILELEKLILLEIKRISVLYSSDAQ